MIAALSECRFDMVGAGLAKFLLGLLNIPIESPASDEDFNVPQARPQPLAKIPRVGKSAWRQRTDAYDPIRVLCGQFNELGGQRIDRHDLHVPFGWVE